MTPLTMLQLSERFDPRPLIPEEILEERRALLEQLGIKAPLLYGEATAWRYHVDPLPQSDAGPDDPLVRLRHAVLHGRTGTKHFLTGSKGAGKSTTINAIRIAPEIKQRFKVIGFSVHDFLNPESASSDQLVAVLIAVVVEAIQSLKPDAELGDIDAKQALKHLKHELRGALPGVKLDRLDVKLFGVATAGFKESENARAAFKRFMDGRPHAVLDMLDRLIEILAQAVGKEVLVVIDDLDKLSSPATQGEFFSFGLPILLRPRCNAIYTYPLELERDPTFRSLKEQSHRTVLRNIKLFRDRSYREMLPEGQHLLEAFIAKRLDRPLHEILDPALIPVALRYSGGNFRELGRILNHAFTWADISGVSAVDRACVLGALRRLREDYNPFLYSYRSVLEAVSEQEQSDIPPGMLGPLVQSLALMEYPDDPGWLDVHPIVRDLLRGEPSG